jgi:hypothetical protein
MVKPVSLKIVWDIDALNQFKEILIYLEEQSKQAPKIVKTAIVDRIKQIKDNPLVCELDKLKTPPNKDFRAFVIFSYRVTYQLNWT